MNPPNQRSVEHAKMNGVLAAIHSASAFVGRKHKKNCKRKPKVGGNRKRSLKNKMDLKARKVTRRNR